MEESRYVERWKVLRSKGKKKTIGKKKMNGNIWNYKALSIYAFKGGFKRHNARFYNGDYTDYEINNGVWNYKK